MNILSKFAIRGLYNERDIEISFNSNVCILVAENGYGKTTVLNALYALLSGDISRLRKIDFNSLELDFVDGERYEIDREEILLSTEDFKGNGIYDHISRRIGENSFYNLMESIYFLPETTFKRSHSFRNAADKLSMPPSSLYQLLSETKSSRTKRDIVKSRSKIEKIRSKFNLKLIYLPTYRRVEQDIKELGIHSEDNLNQFEFINFGMSDVDNKIKEITKEILTSSVEWFSKVNGEMLSQLVEGFHVTEELRNSISNPDAIEIVLDRIGSNIDLKYKIAILDLIKSKEIYNNHDPLIYFIANLLKVYEQQKENDKCIQDFTTVCNRYLGDKKLEYNESNVTVDIVRRKNGKNVDIENLSSGEKQIISLFAKLYLQKDSELAIFFDEPELSLSMEWQKTLLPDIINSGKCKFLFTTTHSPFIFENELIKNTVDLATFIKEL